MLESSKGSKGKSYVRTVGSTVNRLPVIRTSLRNSFINTVPLYEN